MPPRLPTCDAKAVAVAVGTLSAAPSVSRPTPLEVWGSKSLLYSNPQELGRRQASGQVVTNGMPSGLTGFAPQQHVTTEQVQQVRSSRGRSCCFHHSRAGSASGSVSGAITVRTRRAFLKMQQCVLQVSAAAAKHPHLWQQAAAVAGCQQQLEPQQPQQSIQQPHEDILTTALECTLHRSLRNIA